MRVAIGALLCALPLVAIGAVMVRLDGWKVTAIVWGVSLAITACVVTGALLAFGSGS